MHWETSGIWSRAIIALLVSTSALHTMVPSAGACDAAKMAVLYDQAVADTIPYARYYRDFHGAASTVWFLWLMAEADSANYWQTYHGAREWLEETAEPVAYNPLQYRWRMYQGYKEGIYAPRFNASIGSVFLAIWEADTTDTDARTYARAAANWLIRQQVYLDSTYTGDPDYYAWPIRWQQGGTSDTCVHYGWTHGITSIGEFLFNAWKTDTSDTTYLHYAKGTANFLISVAETATVNGKLTAAWDPLDRYWSTAADTLANSSYCRGTAGIVVLLDSLHNRYRLDTQNELFAEGDSVFGQYARAGLQWLMNNTKFEGDYPAGQEQAWWYWEPDYSDSLYSPSRGGGAAGISEVFLASVACSVAPRQTLEDYEDYAKYAANWDTGGAPETDPSRDGRRWRDFYTNNPPYSPKYFTGLCQGTTGVTHFLGCVCENWWQSSGYKAWADSGRVWLEDMLMADASAGGHHAWRKRLWQNDGDLQKRIDINARGVPGIGLRMFQIWKADTTVTAYRALADTAAKWLVAERETCYVYGGYKWRRWSLPGTLDVSIAKASQGSSFTYSDTLRFNLSVTNTSTTDTLYNVFVWVDAFGEEDSYLPRTPSAVVDTLLPEETVSYQNKAFPLCSLQVGGRWYGLDPEACSCNAYAGGRDVSTAKNEWGRPVDQDHFGFSMVEE